MPFAEHRPLWINTAIRGTYVGQLNNTSITIGQHHERTTTYRHVSKGPLLEHVLLCSPNVSSSQRERCGRTSNIGGGSAVFAFDEYVPHSSAKRVQSLVVILENTTHVKGKLSPQLRSTSSTTPTRQSRPFLKAAAVSSSTAAKLLRDFRFTAFERASSDFPLTRKYILLQFCCRGLAYTGILMFTSRALHASLLHHEWRTQPTGRGVNWNKQTVHRAP